MRHVELRAMVPANAEIFAAWATDPVFAAHAGWRHAATPGELIPWWQNHIADPGPTLIRLTAVHDDDVLGYVDLHGDDETSRELGFVIGPSIRWGGGWGTLLGRAGLAYGVEKLGLDSIWAEALEANVASVRILERLGMTYTGRGSDEEFLGAPSTYLQYRVSRIEWAQSEPSNATA